MDEIIKKKIEFEISQLDIKNPEVYENPKIEYGIVTWNNGEIDCAPEYMYEHGFVYNTDDIISVA